VKELVFQKKKKKQKKRKKIEKKYCGIPKGLAGSGGERDI
jgi:hypothetical protein